MNSIPDARNLVRQVTLRDGRFAAVFDRVPGTSAGGELAGLDLDGSFLPFPGCGLECELGVLARGTSGRVQPALAALLARRRGVRAAAAGDRDESWTEAERQFDELGSSYREGDHLELNTWYCREAWRARLGLERQLDAFGRLAAVGGEVLLYALGADGAGASWSSLHVNVAISDLCYDQLIASQRRGTVAFDWYLPAQVSLAVVDGNGGVGGDGFLLCDRLGEFDRVFGAGTMRPCRAMLPDRAEGFGNRRVMNMLRALSFGRGSVAGLAATQLDCLITDLLVHGALDAPSLAFDDPVAAAAELGRYEARQRAAQLQRRVQDIRHAVLDLLAQALGEPLVGRLLPGVRDELLWIDATLEAVARDDEDELLARCEWARKREVMADVLSRRRGGFAAQRDLLREVNVHWARLDDEALRHGYAESALPPGPSEDVVPADTSSWFLSRLVALARADQGWAAELGEARLDWSGVSRTSAHWLEPAGGAWPWAQRRTQRIELVPWRFTRDTAGPVLERARDLDDLFEALGSEESTYGDYAGRAWGGPTASRPAWRGET